MQALDADPVGVAVDQVSPDRFTVERRHALELFEVEAAGLHIAHIVARIRPRLVYGTIISPAYKFIKEKKRCTYCGASCFIPPPMLHSSNRALALFLSSPRPSGADQPW
ncbi:hypothetical protein LP420_21870 [Massilia sp. B-10]|nr:hypothetical protein LP420_21870 [Massilia sp. B-10]